MPMPTLSSPSSICEHKQPLDKHSWGNLDSLNRTFTLSQLGQCPWPTIILTPDVQSAYRLARELPFFTGDKGSVSVLPQWETLPYDAISPHQDLSSSRIRELTQLPTIDKGVIIIPLEAMLNRLCQPTWIQQQCVQLTTGQTLALDEARRHFAKLGYYSVEQVTEPGEFAVRGSLFDLYPMGSQHPVRVDLFDDEIESIRVFDPQAQRSGETTKTLDLLPAHEYPMDAKTRSTFALAWQDYFGADKLDNAVLMAVEQGKPPPGIEYYLRLFHENTASLADYLPNNAQLIWLDDLPNAAQNYWDNIQERYRQLRDNRQRPILAPHDAFVRPEDLFAQLKDFDTLRISKERLPKMGPHRRNFISKPLESLTIESQKAQPWQKLERFVAESNNQILLCTDSDGRREILQEHLQGMGLRPKVITSWAEFSEHNEALCLCTGSLESGGNLCDRAYTVITEVELFPNYVPQRRLRGETNKNPEALLRDISELKVGDPVVHIEHGVGRFIGLSTLDLQDSDSEFLTLSYKNDDKLYVPIEDLHLVSRYSGGALDQAPLHSLSSKAWKTQLEKAAKKAHDIAADLLLVYAKRAQKKGFSFEMPEADYRRFVSDFAFEETPDQSRAIMELIRDLQSVRPMDRLLCGDVGFGKTEVAMRAAFIAVQNHRQVAILVPTTLLAEQHFQTFSDRFASWPVNIQLLSRFRTTKTINHSKADLKAGRCDIVIGTHKLLQKDIEFADLGLMIVDEEHRFGVTHKEQLKRLKAEVDTLALTATPIPRSLNMSLAKIRDLSIIATAPPKRLSVDTNVVEMGDHRIQEAIEREYRRGGQVYYVHNHVNTIEQSAQSLQEKSPHIKFVVAHGQMPERQLESIMADFYHGRFDVLVCTTIIETGIDVPNANTLIIDNADRFGLSQLHQLRGRVGRSHHLAYAYLICPHEKAMTKDARARLEALQSTESLGAGYLLANYDLEIRGAGNLLGDEQSGHIERIGFSLYSELLNRTVSALERGDDLDFQHLIKNPEAEVELNIPALLPEDYIGDTHLRLQIYQRLASTENTEALAEIKAELIDRFGLLPEAAIGLLSTQSLRLQAKSIGISTLSAHAHGAQIAFAPHFKIDPNVILSAIANEPKNYHLSPKALNYQGELKHAKERIDWAQQWLKRLDSQYTPMR